MSQRLMVSATWLVQLTISFMDHLIMLALFYYRLFLWSKRYQNNVIQLLVQLYLAWQAFVIMTISITRLQFSELKFIILYSIQEWRGKAGEMLFVFFCSVLSVFYSHHCVVNWFNGRQLECEFFLSVGYQIIIRTQVERKSAFCQGTCIVYYQDVIW